MEFSEEQQAALATLTIAYPHAIGLTADRADDIATCESLVESGHVVRTERDFDRKSYRLSDEMAAAHCLIVEQRAREAEQN